MGNSRTNDKDNPPAFSFLLDDFNDFVTMVGPNGSPDYSAGHNVAPFPNVPVQVVPPWENWRPTLESYTQGFTEVGGNLVTDFMVPNSLMNHKVDMNPGAFGMVFSGVPLPERDMRNISQVTHHDSKVLAGYPMDCDTGFSGFQTPQTNINSILMINSAGAYQMTSQGVEVKTSHASRSQINENFVALPTTMFYNQNRQRQIGNSANFSADQYGFQQKVDGSSLSLGIRDNAEALSKPTFSSKEIADKLNDSMADISEVQQPISLSLSQNLADDFSGLKVRDRRFSNPASNVDDWNSSSNDLRIIGSANSWSVPISFHMVQTPQVSVPSSNHMVQTPQGPVPSSFHMVQMPQVPVPSSNHMVQTPQGPVPSSFHMVQTPQGLVQYNNPKVDERKSSILSDRSIKYAELDPYRATPSNNAALSGAHDNDAARFLSSQHVSLAQLTQDSVKLARITQRTSSCQLQNFYPKTPKIPSLGMGSSYHVDRGNSTKQNHAGQHLLSHNDNAAQGSGGNVFPLRTGVKLSDNNGGHAGSVGLFPNNPGVGIIGRIGQSIGGRYPFPKGIRGRPAKKSGQPPDSESTQLPGNLVRPSIASDGFVHNYPLSFHGPSSTAGQPRNQLDQLANIPLGTSLTNVASVDDFSRKSDLDGRPSLKRIAVQPPPSTHWLQCQKIRPPIVHPSTAYTPKTVPIPLSAPVTPHIMQPTVRPSTLYPPLSTAIPASAPALAHIRRKGSDGFLLQPTGHKCFLCKRDLSFTSEGPISRPAAPPPVAVLPCGHTFHDQCLTNITPKDQSKDPPCIPCAIGEN